MASREYKTINNEMRILLLSNKAGLEMACAFKEDYILKKTKLLRENLLKVASIFWNARETTWDNAHAQIKKITSEEIDPNISGL